MSTETTPIRASRSTGYGTLDSTNTAATFAGSLGKRALGIAGKAFLVVGGITTAAGTALSFLGQKCERPVQFYATTYNDVKINVYTPVPGGGYVETQVGEFRTGHTNPDFICTSSTFAPVEKTKLWYDNNTGAADVCRVGPRGPQVDSYSATMCYDTRYECSDKAPSVSEVCSSHVAPILGPILTTGGLALMILGNRLSKAAESRVNQEATSEQVELAEKV